MKSCWAHDTVNATDSDKRAINTEYNIPNNVLSVYQSRPTTMEYGIYLGH